MRISFFISILFILIGCQGAKEKSFKRAKVSSYDVGKNFIHLNGLYSISANDLFNIHSETVVIEKTENIFYLTSHLFFLSSMKEQSGRLNEAKQIRLLAYRILNSFESSDSSWTYFNHNNSSYLELALGLAMDGTEDLQTIFDKTLDNQKIGLSKAIKNISNRDFILQELERYKISDLDKTQDNSKIEGNNSLLINKIVQFYVDFINGLPEILEKENVDSSIVNSVKERVNNEFSGIVDGFRNHLQNINKHQSLKDNLKFIELALKTLEVEDSQTGEKIFLLGESFETILDMVHSLHTIADSLLNASKNSEIIDVILQIWTHPLMGEEEKLKFKEKNRSLYNFLINLDEKDIEYLKHYNLGKDRLLLKALAHSFNFKKWGIQYKHTVTWWGIQIEGKQEILDLLNTSINESVILELDEQIRFHTPGIVEEILNFISSEVDSVHNEKRSNMFNVFREEGRIYFDNLFGSSFEPLRGFELQGGTLVLGENNSFKVERVESNKRETSSRLVALSMMTYAQKMAKYDKDLSINPTGLAFYRDIFSELNKLVSILGYRLMESPSLREPSFFRPVLGRNPDAEPDVFSYNNETGIFSIPRIIPLKGALSIDKERVKGSEAISDIGDMALIVRGASLYMEYFKDWKSNNLDQKFVKESFQLEKKSDLIYVFPKDTFYALALGLASVPLRNLQRDGVYVYTKDKGKGSYQEYLNGALNKEDSQTESVDPIVQVAVTDVTSEGMIETVKAADLAQLIMAADEFISATDDFEKSKNETIRKVENGERVNYISINEGRDLLYDFIIGLANFLSGKMIKSDGGVFHSYSVKNNELLPWLRERPEGGEKVATFDRTLHDQLVVMQAMARVARRTGIKGYADIGLNIYKYLMNSHYQSAIGVFNSIENTNEGSISLIDAVQLILSLEELSFVLDNSSAEAYQQIQELKGLYTMRLIDIYRTTQD